MLLSLLLCAWLFPMTASAATEGYMYEVIDETAKTAEIILYEGSATDLTIPATLDGYSVTSIGGLAFASRTSLTSVTIPEGVESIGNGAFRDCASLTSVTIPEGVTSIGTDAFMNCTSLASVTIPEGVPSIGDHAFYNCTSLASVTIPEGVTRIGLYAFVDCTSLASVTIPEGVTSIGDYAFMNCNSLESVTIPEGVESIGPYAFMNCNSLESVTILESVASIGDDVFAGCSNLKTLTIPCTLNIDDAGVPSGITTMIHDWENGACKNCKETCQHTGGTATCTDKAVCTNSGSAYGTLDFGNHAGTLTKTEAKLLPASRMAMWNTGLVLPAIRTSAIPQGRQNSPARWTRPSVTTLAAALTHLMKTVTGISATAQAVVPPIHRQRTALQTMFPTITPPVIRTVRRPPNAMTAPLRIQKQTRAAQQAITMAKPHIHGQITEALAPQAAPAKTIKAM